MMNDSSFQVGDYPHMVHSTEQVTPSEIVPPPMEKTCISAPRSKTRSKSNKPLRVLYSLFLPRKFNKFSTEGNKSEKSAEIGPIGKYSGDDSTGEK